MEGGEPAAAAEGAEEAAPAERERSAEELAEEKVRRHCCVLAWDAVSLLRCAPCCGSTLLVLQQPQPDDEPAHGCMPVAASLCGLCRCNPSRHAPHHLPCNQPTSPPLPCPAHSK